MDKWLELVVGESQTALGLNLNTRKLTVGIPRKYLDETLSLILTTWFKGSQSRRGRGKDLLQLKLQRWLASYPPLLKGQLGFILWSLIFIHQ